MRMRAKKNLIPRLEKVSYLLEENPEILKGNWGEKDLHLEIGCGKGDFICQSAQNNPDIYFVAIELVKEALIIALEKADRMGLENIRFISGDARKLNEYFDKGEVKRIYLNFSDPWPKKNHAIRRLTHRDFLTVYKDILDKNGEIHQKTDNVDLFKFSLESYDKMGCTVSELTYDLHSTDFENNIMTEYEKKFTELGKPICRVVAKFPNE